MSIKTFREILAWQKAHELVLEIYRVTKAFPKEETYGLISQMRRSAVSIPSNVAEGFKRCGKKDAAHFYNISQASLEELKYQIILAYDLEYIRNSDILNLHSLSDEVGRMLHGWMKVQKCSYR